MLAASELGVGSSMLGDGDGSQSLVVDDAGSEGESWMMVVMAKTRTTRRIGECGLACNRTNVVLQRVSISAGNSSERDADTG